LICSPWLRFEARQLCLALRGEWSGIHAARAAIQPAPALRAMLPAGPIRALRDERSGDDNNAR